MQFGKPALAAVGLVGVVTLVALGNRQPTPAPAAGQPKAEAAAIADEAAVRKSAQQFEEAFNKKDARAVAALWTENGELTDVDGTVVRGRAELEKMYTAAFAATPKSQGKIEVEAVRPLGTNLLTTEHLATAEVYAEQATAIADVGRAEQPAAADEERQPLGVYGMVQGEEAVANVLFQLAVNKAGLIRGNYYDALGDNTLPVFGSVDK
jgi:uncharacterized protein (TIGR02246 family)